MVGIRAGFKSPPWVIPNTRPLTDPVFAEPDVDVFVGGVVLAFRSLTTAIANAATTSSGSIDKDRNPIVIFLSLIVVVSG
jgi:hypothetical protein